MTILSNVPGMLEPPASRPASSYDEAISRARAMMALDASVALAPHAGTTLHDHGKKTNDAVVLLHGLTNHPGQYVEFAPMVFEAGANVFIPRFPYHGESNRLTTSIGALTAQQMIACAVEALDIACGLGEHLSVLGISLGGLLSAYVGQFRSDVHLAVPIAPDFGLLQLPYGATKMLAAVVRMLPSLWLWWDPRVRMAQRPKTAYPRFPTHVLMETLRIGDAIYTAAHTQKAQAQKIVTVVNRADPAVNNAVTLEVVTEWRALRGDGIEYVELRALPENHDIIDPDNPEARTDLVYPELLKILGLAPGN